MVARKLAKLEYEMRKEDPMPLASAKWLVVTAEQYEQGYEVLNGTSTDGTPNVEKRKFFAVQIDHANKCVVVLDPQCESFEFEGGLSHSEFKQLVMMALTSQTPAN
jgi:hypothetical protein